MPTPSARFSPFATTNVELELVAQARDVRLDHPQARAREASPMNSSLIG